MIRILRRWLLLLLLLMMMMMKMMMKWSVLRSETAVL